jgi:adenylate cyclase
MSGAANRKNGRGSIRRLWLVVVIAAVVCSVTVPGFSRLAPLAFLEGAIVDRMTAVVRKPLAAQYSGISVITINEATMARLPYRSPIDRGFLSDVLLAIEGAGVRAVAFDILFDQPTEADKDLRLAETIRNYPVPVVLAWADERAGLTDKQQVWLEEFLSVSGALPGVVELQLDADAVVRHHQPVDPVSGIASLSAAVTGTQGGQREPIAWLAGTKDGKDAFQVLPAHSIVLMAKRPAILKRWLEGRVVLIGADLPQQDRHKTRLSADPTKDAATAGVLVHAHVAAQMLDGRTVAQPSLALLVILTFLLAVLGGLIAVSARPFWLQISAGLALAVVWGALVLWMMHAWSILLPVASILAALAVTYALSAGLEAIRQRQEKAFIRDAFGHYVAPSLVDELSRDPGRLRLGGERRVLSFIFTDIAGFTTMSEALPPVRLTSLLNAYLDGMSEIVLRHGGTLDKFIGDAVVAIFGAPVDQEDHASRALACALELDAFAEYFRRLHTTEGLGITRIGVHFGEATVGNFGGDNRFDYTAMGDAMNTAARLEGANKAFGTRVLVSGDLLSAAGSRSSASQMCKVGDVILKGRSATLEVFSPQMDASEPQVVRYNEAIDMLGVDQLVAGQMFSDLEREWPKSPLIRFHAARLAAGESGVSFELKEK